MLSFIANFAPALSVKEVTTAMARLQDVVAPTTLNGLTVEEVLNGAALLLIERGELGALDLAQDLAQVPNEVEYRTLMRLRKAMQDTVRGGHDG